MCCRCFYPESFKGRGNTVWQTFAYTILSDDHVDHLFSLVHCVSWPINSPFGLHNHDYCIMSECYGDYYLASETIMCDVLKSLL